MAPTVHVKVGNRLDGAGCAGLPWLVPVTRGVHPVAESLWKKLNRDVSLANVAQAFRAVAANAQSVPGDALVDRVLDAAEQEAVRRGISVGDVLRERGFDLPDEVVERVALRRTQANIAVDDAVAPPAGEPGGAPRPASPPGGVEAYLALHAAGPWAAAESARVRRWLGTQQCAEQAVLAGLMDEGRRSELIGRPEGPGLADAMLERCVDPVRLRHLADCVGGSIPLENQEPFVDALVEQDVVPYRSLRAARDQAASAGTATLLELERMHPELGDKLWEWVSRWLGQSWETGEPEVADEIRNLVPWVRAFEMAPIRTAGTDSLVMAGAFAAPAWWLERLAASAGTDRIAWTFASPARVQQWRSAWLQQFAVARSAPQARSKSPEPRAPTAHATRLEGSARSGSAVRFAEELLEVAVQARATDIHVEPLTSTTRVRLRVDGVCVEAGEIAHSLAMEVTARLKVLAGMDVTERRRPQDGSLHMSAAGRTLDLRLSTTPTRRGEKLAIRIADGSAVSLNLTDLGLQLDDAQRVRDVAQRPHGLLLTTGPVGSGKTTTLYACLSELDRSRLQIASIEDPVEIELDGANQVEVNRLTGLDFPSGLRALLRQDPDVILIGEIRDTETAQIGVRAAMTGRMVYSTLHANSAAEAVTTLRNLGVPNFIIASTLQGVIAQRLVRRVCPHCAVSVKLSREELASIGVRSLPRGAQPRRGTGCAHCAQTGYLGRIGVFEVLVIDGATRALIEDGGRGPAIEASAREAGQFRSLHEASLVLIAEGLTTPEERHRVLGPPPAQN
jgi:type II secretory ATPase GspE/PulE/Tfp pilus assembly ATPase PilB-like protein